MKKPFLDQFQNYKEFAPSLEQFQNYKECAPSLCRFVNGVTNVTEG